MGYQFIRGDRDQQFLMPPDMRDWLPADHLAWFVIDVVERLDLEGFHRAYRADGHGRAAYDPAVMVALLLYAYCTGVRSSRAIERRCIHDVAYRVLAGGLFPDHVTIARFRARHAEALAEVFVASLRLCAEAGLVRLGAVALDGTKIGANASGDANRTLEALTKQVNELIAQAAEIDAVEDARESGSADQQERAGVVDPAARKATLDAARERLSEAQARLQAVADERAARLAERQNASDMARAAKRLPPRQLRPRARDEAPQPEATTNLTDPDSRVMLGRHGRLQGYNAQVVCTPEQIIVAAELTQAGNDLTLLPLMLTATRTTLTQAGITDDIGALVADAGYWRAANVDGSVPDAPELFIAVARHGWRGKTRQDGKPSNAKTEHLVAAMTTKLDTDTGKRMMRMRRTSVEPIFGQTKHARGIRTLSRRGLSAAHAEWRLIAATHNLLKLHRAGRPAV